MAKELYWGTQYTSGTSPSSILSAQGKLIFSTITVIPRDEEDQPVDLDFSTVQEYGAAITSIQFLIDQPDKTAAVCVMGAGVDVLGIHSNVITGNNVIGVRVSPWIKFGGNETQKKSDVTIRPDLLSSTNMEFCIFMIGEKKI